MFEKGNFILYGTVGVCLVSEISKTDFSDSNRLYYNLVPKFEKKTTIYIPVDSDKVMMRKIMTRQEAECLVSSWSTLECKKYGSDKERPQIYKQIFQSGSYLELAAMIKEIVQIQQSCKKKLLSMREKDGLKMARKLLFEELAVALNIFPEEVADYIHRQTGCFC